MDIRYGSGILEIADAQFDGFCVGWARPMSGMQLRQALLGSDSVIAAFDQDRVIGFISALSDRTAFAYIPMVEVRPSYQGLGIGTELVRRMIERYRHLYGIDLLCDTSLEPFYERQGMARVVGMCLRNFAADYSSSKP